MRPDWRRNQRRRNQKGGASDEELDRNVKRRYSFIKGKEPKKSFKKKVWLNEPNLSEVESNTSMDVADVVRSKERSSNSKQKKSSSQNYGKWNNTSIEVEITTGKKRGKESNMVNPGNME